MRGPPKREAASAWLPPQHPPPRSRMGDGRHTRSGPAPPVKRGGDAASRDCPAVKPLAPTSLTRADREAKLTSASRQSPRSRQQEADL
jgi:hypothetical protein